MHKPIGGRGAKCLAAVHPRQAVVTTAPMLHGFSCSVHNIKPGCPCTPVREILLADVHAVLLLPLVLA